MLSICSGFCRDARALGLFLRVPHIWWEDEKLWEVSFVMTPWYLKYRNPLFQNCTVTSWRMLFLENGCLHVSNIVLLVRFSTTQKTGKYWPKLRMCTVPKDKRYGRRWQDSGRRLIQLFHVFWRSEKPVGDTRSRTDAGLILWILRDLSLAPTHPYSLPHSLGNSPALWACRRLRMAITEVGHEVQLGRHLQK